MTVSPISELIGNNMTDSVVIQPVTSYSKDGGQPVLGTSRTVKCKVTVIQNRTLGQYGDTISNTGYKVLLPGDDPTETEDRLTLSEYGIGPINGTLNIIKDWNGKIIAKEIVIL
ncbi:MAG: hypothetical protein WC936_06100 [Candidatus Nanoarchaeia archaeon]|jgi:hypothetical protein